MSNTFKPKPPKKHKVARHITYVCDPDRYEELRDIAGRSGISLKELMRQMVDFALSNMEGKNNA